MILFPPAKINLGLKILGKRSDNYHEIETCMLTVGITDVMEILPSEEFSFSHSGIPINGARENNLVVQAYQLLKENYSFSNVAIHLQKNIPMGAGLGGGSADATYVLTGLNSMFDLGLSVKELQGYASKLGSDCAFFVEDNPQLAFGRGEVLKNVEVSLTGKYLRIINPGIHIGTKEAYANVNFSSKETSVESIVQQPISDWKRLLKNDFELSAFKRHKTLGVIKERMYNEGAVYASMTGSGSTMYAIYESCPKSWNDYEFERVILM